MFKTVQKNVIEQNMIETGDVVLAAVSGGADSLGLLYFLLDLRKGLDFTLEVVHVEHGIRGEESREDAAFVQRLCERLGVPCFCQGVDALTYGKERGIGIEEAARILRYEVFERTAKERGAKVALAHHMEDNAETILFQMVRGSGIAGLCGMKAIRTEPNVTYIRPLLTVQREDIEKFLIDLGVQWREDSTNKEIEYSRNYLRHKVLPHLEKLNERAVEHMNQSAEHLSEVYDFVRQEMLSAWSDVISEEIATDGSLSLKVDLGRFETLHLALKKELLMEVLFRVAKSRKDLTATHVQELLTLCDRQSGKTMTFPYEIVARREFDTLVVGKKDVSEVAQEMLCVTENDMLRLLKQEDYYVELSATERLCFRAFSRETLGEEMEQKIPKKEYTKWFDYDKIRQGFCIRTRQNGDYFISDRAGHRKKLQNYFVDEKIPLDKRDRLWLLAQDSYVLWVIGGRISEDAKVTTDTKVILEIEYIGG